MADKDYKNDSTLNCCNATNDAGNISKINIRHPKIRLEMSLGSAYLSFCAEQQYQSRTLGISDMNEMSGMSEKLTDQIERDWMRQELQHQSLDGPDDRLLLVTCTIIALFVTFVLATAR